MTDKRVANNVEAAMAARKLNQRQLDELMDKPKNWTSKLLAGRNVWLHEADELGEALHIPGAILGFGTVEDVETYYYVEHRDLVIRHSRWNDEWARQDALLKAG